MSDPQPADRPAKSGGLKSGFHTPAAASAIGMYLFLGALFMLFASGMLGYVLIRGAAAQKFALGSLHLPSALWISTVLVVAASFTIQAAVAQVRRERQGPFRRWLLVTLVLAIAFVIVQAPCMAILIARQHAMLKQQLALYGFVFVLVLLHAAHVVGGIVALIQTWIKARRGVYDHEHYQPVHYMALYWHFLDGVWLVMFFTFLLMG